MGKRYPKEFRDDVVRVARQGDTSIEQLAKDFGVSDASIYNWLKQADIDDGVRPGLTEKEAEELREVVEQCVQSVAAGQLPFRGTAHPCEYAPMFLPSTSDAGQAARNTNDAINTGQPPILTYEPSSEATTRVKAELVALGLTSGRPRRWYTATVLGIPGVRAFPQCVALPTNNACDEYPYFSSTTSGPGAHLAPAPTDKNSLEGSAYGAFAYNCPATNAEREPLIVVPLIDPVIWVPTFGICR